VFSEYLEIKEMATSMHNDEDEEDKDINFRKRDEIFS